MLCSDEIITNSKHPPPHAYIDLPILQFHLHISNIIHLIPSITAESYQSIYHDDNFEMLR